MRSRAVVTLGVVAALAAVCSSATGAEVDKAKSGGLALAAKGEGALTWYTSQPAQTYEPIVQAMRDKYGITVNVLRLLGGALMARVETEVKAGGASADVVTAGDLPRVVQNPADLFTPLDKLPSPDELTGITSFPANARDTYFATTMIIPFGVAYNTKFVTPEQVPRTWADLADRRYKGRLVLSDPRNTSAYMGWADAVEKQFGPSLLQSLGTQDLKVTEGGQSGAQAVAAGGAWVNFPTMGIFPEPFRAKGAPIGFQVISEPNAVTEVSGGVVKATKRPNAAALLLNLIVSKEGQTLQCVAYQRPSLASPISLNGEIPSCVKLPANWKPVLLSPPEQRKKELTRALGLGG